MTREEEILIEKVIWLIEDSYPDTDEWGHDTLVVGIKKALGTRADELNRLFGESDIPTSTWHKVSEELPPYDKDVIVSYDGNTDDCCFNHRSNNPDVKTTQHDWCEIGCEGEPTHWMEIPEIK